MGYSVVPSQAKLSLKAFHNDLGTEQLFMERQEPNLQTLLLASNNSCSSASDKIWKQFYRNILCFSDSFNYFL